MAGQIWPLLILSSQNLLASGNQKKKSFSYKSLKLFFKYISHSCYVNIRSLKKIINFQNGGSNMAPKFKKNNESII